MSNVQEQELSALIDGELDPARAKEVRARINSDPALRKEYDALARLDARLCTAGAEAAFTPDVTLPEVTARTVHLHGPTAIAVVLSLVAIRFLPKVVDLQLLGLGIQLAAGIVIAFAVIRMATAPDSLAPSPSPTGA